MLTRADFDNLRTWLATARRPLLFSHRRPDGDALGALAALAQALREAGQRPEVALYEPFPLRYALLKDATTWHDWATHGATLAAACDAVVILDTCALTQLEPVAEFLARAPRMLVIDHHATRDPLATRPGDLRILDETAGATCLILAEWFAAAGITRTPLLATALLIGIATDCGWFRFSNTDARMLRAAGELVACGAAAGEIHAAIYQQDPPEKLRLIARMLASLELRAEGRLAVMSLRQADFVAAGADRSLTEDLVNEAGRLGCTEATLLLTGEPDGVVRANFRSKRVLDVAQLAARFGGGGHARAAGARLRGVWDDVVPQVVAVTEEALKKVMSDEGRQ